MLTVLSRSLVECYYKGSKAVTFNHLNETINIKNNIKNNKMSSWYLLQCKPREEQRARQNLNNQGFTTYLPETKIAKRTKNGFSEVPVPLFPGYLFIQLNCKVDNYAVIRSTRGVSKLVSFGNQIAVVPDTVITLIKQQSLSNESKAIYPFNKGDKVTITAGPFKALEALFDSRNVDSRNGQQRSWIFLELMGKWQRISINDMELNKVA